MLDPVKGSTIVKILVHPDPFFLLEKFLNLEINPIMLIEIP